jgi:hypothetical protein
MPNQSKGIPGADSLDGHLWQTGEVALPAGLDPIGQQPLGRECQRLHRGTVEPLSVIHRARTSGERWPALTLSSCPGPAVADLGA